MTSDILTFASDEKGVKIAKIRVIMNTTRIQMTTSQEIAVNEIIVDRQNMEVINSYIYQRQLILLTKDTQDLEIKICTKLNLVSD